MPRPLRYPDKLKSSFPAGTLAAIDATGEDRQEFVRRAVDELLERVKMAKETA